MKERRIPQECFDLGGFYDRTLEFIRTIIIRDGDPTYSIGYAKELDHELICGALGGTDVFAELLKGEGVFYFPFAVHFDKNLSACADGNIYGPLLKYDENGQGVGWIPLGPSTDLGIFIHLEGGEMVLRSALREYGQFFAYSGKILVGWSGVNLCDETMTRFIDQFNKN